jgi:transmembrane sensor
VIPASFIDVNTDFNHFSAADFLSNDDFIAYQLNPDSDTAKNWQVWLSTTPPNVSEWNDAVYLLESIQLGLYNYSSNILSDEAILSLLQRIQQTNNEKQDHKVIIPLRPWKWIAAAVLLIFGALFLVRLLTKNEAKTYYSLRVTDTDKKHVERINNTGTSQTAL